MPLGLTELVVGGLAAWQAVEVWHHSALMAGPRARAELLEGKLGQLLTCPFCLSVWVGVAACLVLATPWAGPPSFHALLDGVGVVGLPPALAGAAYVGWGTVGDVREKVWPDLTTRFQRACVVVAVFFGFVAPLLVLAGSLFVLDWRAGGPVAAGFAADAAKVFVYGLAVARLANLGNDVTHRWCRTPRANRLEFKTGFEEDASGGTADAGPAGDTGAGDVRPGRD